MAAAIAALRGAYGDSHSNVGRAYGRFSPIAWHFKRNLRWIERDEIQKLVFGLGSGPIVGRISENDLSKGSDTFYL